MTTETLIRVAAIAAAVWLVGIPTLTAAVVVVAEWRSRRPSLLVRETEAYLRAVAS